MVNKRGISAIVATVLILLITIVAVTIVWVILIPLLQGSFSSVDVDGGVSIVSSGGYTVWDSEKQVATVKVSGKPGSSIIEKVRLTFFFEDGSSESNLFPAPGPKEERVYEFLFNEGAAPVQVSVAPLVIDGSSEREASAFPVDLMSGNLPSMPANKDFLNLERDYFAPIPSLPLDDIKLWWRFEGNADDEAVGFSGTIQGDVDFTEGVAGQAITFDEDGEYAELRYPTSIPSPGSFSAWFRVRDLESDIKYAVFGAYYTSAHYVGIWVENGTRQLIGSTSVATDWNNYVVRGSLGAIQDDVWYHVVFTVDGPDLKIYLDGELDGSATVSNGDYPIQVASFEVGRSDYSSSMDFRGDIDEFMMYDRVLSASEVYDIYINQSNS
jgi:hypothetical protein